MSRTLDIPATDLALVRSILRKHLPADAHVWVFGSRVTGGARRYSDLDLAIECEMPLAFELIGALTEALSESDLPYKVDVVDLRQIDSAFRAQIEPDFAILTI